MPDAADMAELATLQASYLPALETVTGRLRGLLGTPPTFEGVSLTATSRLKTVATIVEKLRHHETSLGRMRDVVGVRIVGDLYLPGQDRLVDVVARLFSVNTDAIIDRRLIPRHGYRAVHVVSEVEGYPVEVQIRTILQHYWANGMERMADFLGRQIRYGEPPNASGPEQLARRQLLLDGYKREADLLADFEVAQDRAYRSALAADEAIEALEHDPMSASTAEIEGLKDRAQVARRAMRDVNDALRAQMDLVTELLGPALD